MISSLVSSGSALAALVPSSQFPLLSALDGMSRFSVLDRELENCSDSLITSLASSGSALAALVPSSQFPLLPALDGTSRFSVVWFSF